MLTIYKRRHDQACLDRLAAKKLISSSDATKLSAVEEKYLAGHMNCRCAFWVTGTNDHGVFFPRQSLHAYTFDAAKQKVKEMNQPTARPRPGLSIQAAGQAWLEQSTLRNLSPYTMHAHKRTIEWLSKVCRADKVHEISKVTALHVQRLRAAWVKGGAEYTVVTRGGGESKRTYKPIRATTHHTRMAHLGAFFTYCMRQGWVQKNLAYDAPVVEMAAGEKEEATMPLDLDGTEANYRKILDMVHPYLNGDAGSNCRQFHGRKYQKRMWDALTSRPDHFYALLELMYHTGLRISDAIRFDLDKLEFEADCATYSTIQVKTKLPVTCFLPLWLAEKLHALPQLAPHYLFWDGSSTMHGYYNNGFLYHLKLIGKLAGVDGVRAHRFRDSFAVNRLNEGMLIQDVQKLLGHSSVKTTERYYAPFVRSRHDRLKGLVTAAWKPKLVEVPKRSGRRRDAALPLRDTRRQPPAST